MPQDRDISLYEQEQLLLLFAFYLGQNNTMWQVPRLLALLFRQYTNRGSPYGADVDGFERWMFELWPTPPTA